MKVCSITEGSEHVQYQNSIQSDCWAFDRASNKYKLSKIWSLHSE